MFSNLREWFCKSDATKLQQKYNWNASGPAQSSALVTVDAVRRKFPSGQFRESKRRIATAMRTLRLLHCREYFQPKLLGAGSV